jgi:hypothetical protein
MAVNGSVEVQLDVRMGVPAGHVFPASLYKLTTQTLGRYSRLAANHTSYISGIL